MSQLQNITDEQRRKTSYSLESFFLASFINQSHCVIKHVDGRKARISLSQGADLVWEIHDGGEVVELYTSIPDILNAGWLVE